MRRPREKWSSGAQRERQRNRKREREGGEREREGGRETRAAISFPRKLLCTHYPGHCSALIPRAHARVLHIRATINPAACAARRADVHSALSGHPRRIPPCSLARALTAVNKIGKRRDDLRRRRGSKGFRSIGRKRGCSMYRYTITGASFLLLPRLNDPADVLSPSPPPSLHSTASLYRFEGFIVFWVLRTNNTPVFASSIVERDRDVGLLKPRKARTRQDNDRIMKNYDERAR